MLTQELNNPSVSVGSFDEKKQIRNRFERKVSHTGVQNKPLMFNRNRFCLAMLRLLLGNGKEISFFKALACLQGEIRATFPLTPRAPTGNYVPYATRPLLKCLYRYYQVRFTLEENPIIIFTAAPERSWNDLGENK